MRKQSVEPHLSSKKLFIRLIVSVLLLALAAGIFIYRQELVDMYLFQQFKPVQSIEAITKRTQLTEKGKFYFYASHPELKDRQTFNQFCKAQDTEESVVLGCYTRLKIYLFDIDNPKLDGIEEVTAAHEMLHAAYDRLSSSERERVDGLLEQQLRTITDERILSLVKVYDKTEPGERLNELHSILGTELATLSPELETYYQRYFKDRSAVVALANNYASVFEDLKSRMDSLLAELNALADSIEVRNAQYKATAAQLNADIEVFNTRARSGQMTQAEFNAERAALENRQDALQALYDSIKDEIALYNSKRSELEAVNTESDVLNRSIDSKLSPVPSI